jgi:hypothetical protein
MEKYLGRLDTLGAVGFTLTASEEQGKREEALARSTTGIVAQ